MSDKLRQSQTYESLTLCHMLLESTVVKLVSLGPMSKEFNPNFQAKVFTEGPVVEF